MRPGLIGFLDQVQKLFDVFFLTASQADYANQIIDRIAPQVRPCRRFCRDACQFRSGFLVKDLRLLRRPLDRVVLVDDLAGSALVNPENLIRVNPWNGKRMDNLLLSHLLPILQNIAHERELAKSAREVISKCHCGDIAMFPGVCG
jgi:TFIIF-interacting CTD phosphatase-like protein